MLTTWCQSEKRQAFDTLNIKAYESPKTEVGGCGNTAKRIHLSMTPSLPWLYRADVLGFTQRANMRTEVRQC